MPARHHRQEGMHARVLRASQYGAPQDSHLSATTAAPKPGMTGTSGDRMTRATPATCRSVILGTMRVCSPPAGSSIAMAMLASPAHLNATCTARGGTF